MSVFTKPSWLNTFDFPFQAYKEIPEVVFKEINDLLDQVISEDPVVSIVIPAWNEEVNVLRCVASLAHIKSKYSFEIIIIDNNSTDQTSEMLGRLHIRTYFQSTQGCGPARQLGQEQARGKFILMGDADCIYPKGWIDAVINVLDNPGIVCVYGRYSFMEGPGFPGWKLRIYESMKNVIAEFRHLYHPYFNAYGMNMAYIRELGIQVGFISINRRGEDGQLCLDLMKYGKIKQVRSDKARVWTGTRTLRQDGNFGRVFANRIKKEYRRFFFNLHSKLPENKSKP